jgi:hypothetical protein
MDETRKIIREEILKEYDSRVFQLAEAMSTMIYSAIYKNSRYELASKDIIEEFGITSSDIKKTVDMTVDYLNFEKAIKKLIKRKDIKDGEEDEE